MSTFLELVKNLGSELEIPGEVPASVVSQTGEANRLVRFIRDADLDIQKRYHDWDFLWKGENGFSTTTTLDSTALATTKPTDIGNYDLSSFYLDRTTDDYVHLDYVAWKRYRDEYTLGTQTSDAPCVFSIAPDKTIRVWPQSDSASYALTAEYWKAPVPLTTNTQESLIPAEHERAIIVRAKIYYAEGEDAPEILAGSVGEFQGLIQLLESDELPAQRIRRMSVANEGDEGRVIAR